MVDLASFGVAALLVLLVMFLVMVFPLYFLVKVFGGKTSISKAIFVKLATAFIGFAVLFSAYKIGPVVLAIAFIVIYMIAFKLGIIRAFLVWLLEGTVMAVMIFLLLAIGISALAPELNNIVSLF